MSAKVDWHRAAELGQELGQESLADGGRMSRTLHRLSAVKVAAAKKPGFIADGGNLYLRIAPGGSRQWMFRFALAGKTRDAGLGSYPTVSLVKARQEAERCGGSLRRASTRNQRPTWPMNRKTLTGALFRVPDDKRKSESWPTHEGSVIVEGRSIT